MIYRYFQTAVVHRQIRGTTTLVLLVRPCATVKMLQNNVTRLQENVRSLDVLTGGWDPAVYTVSGARSRFLPNIVGQTFDYVYILT